MSDAHADPRIRRLGALLTLLLVLLLGPHARAGEDLEDEAFLGLPIAEVQLRAPRGGLPEESLDPLLRARAGKPLHAADVRADLVTLFQIGQFASVQAEVEPWVLFDADGEAQEAVLLSYVVTPSPKVGRIRVTGDHPHFSRRALLEAASLSVGEVFFEGLDDVEVIQAIEQHLHRHGYTRPTVEVRTEPLENDRLLVELTVDEGEPNLLERLSFAGDIAEVLPGGNHRLLYRWARRAGVREGKPFEPEAIARAQQEIRAQLASMKGGLRRPRGWVGVRVTPAVARTADGSARVTYTIEPGPQLDLDVSGLGWRGERVVRDALGIDGRLRLTRGWLDLAPERLQDSLARKGWLEAQATVVLDRPNPDEQVLRVEVERGPRHVLRTGLPPGWVGVRFEGNEALSNDDLQRVLDQASQDVIRRDLYADGELEAGLLAARELYRARGYHEAELRLEAKDIRTKPLGPVAILATPLRVLMGKPRRRQVIPTVVVDEGPLTTLQDIQVVGAAIELDEPIRKNLETLRGGPYSPQRIEAISRQVLEQHRAQGYLEADTRVSVTQVEPLIQTATIEVQPGPQLLLRTIVTRGPRYTRPGFVQRELSSRLTIGEPITNRAIEGVRSDLYDLGTFRSVSVSLLGEDAQRDLLIDLTERPRWAYELGAGLSTDQGVRTFGRITRRNLWGLAHRVDVVGQVGLVWRSEFIQDWVPDITSPEWRLAVSYTAPRFPSRRQDLVLDALLRELRQERTWRLARSGGGIALQNHLGRRTDIRTAVRVETRQLQEVDLGALLPDEPWVERLTLGLPSAWRLQESLTALIVHDLRNDPILPTRGTLLSINGEFAPGVPWNGPEAPVTSFLKGSARASTYIPLRGLILRGTVEGSHGISLSDGVIPLEDRYRLGGTGSLRGYRRDAIGPHNLASRLDLDWPAGLEPLIDYTIRANTERWVPTGGDTSALGIFELITPLPALGLTGWDGYALALFADVGNVWLLDDRADATSELPRYARHLPALRVGTGIGARVATPVGPMQVDLALNPQALLAKGERRRLLVHGFDEPAFRAHLTLGAMF